MLAEDMTHIGSPSFLWRFSVLCTHEVHCKGAQDGFL